MYIYATVCTVCIVCAHANAQKQTHLKAHAGQPAFPMRQNIHIHTHTQIRHSLFTHT